MQPALNKAKKWGEQNGLSFAATKTVVVLFGHSRKRLRLPCLAMAGVPLEYSKEAKYLGITLDHKLTFKTHIRNKCNKATRLLMATRKAIGQFWGPTLQATKWIYETMVRPILLYGSLVWAHKAGKSMKLLNRVQRPVS